MGVDVERDLANQVTPRRRNGLPRLYVALWVVLSSASLTYLALMAVRPDLAVGLGQSAAFVPEVEGQHGAVQDAAGNHQLQTDMAELRQGLDKVQRDLEAMRSIVVARDERDQILAARLAAIEAQKLTEPASPLSTASVTRNPALSIEDQGRSAPDTQAGRQTRAREGDRVAAAPVEVKTVATVPAEPTGPRGIQIATGPSVDALRISWMLLSERHKEVLKRYEPRFIASRSGSGPAYRLVVGPLENVAAATKACSELRARRVSCGVAAFGGEPL